VSTEKSHLIPGPSPEGVLKERRANRSLPGEEFRVRYCDIKVGVNNLL
jgi:hypothetical protein